MTSQENEADYAFWSSPAGLCTVTYSLEQFHEIDFLVSEGFRRIPHGGIETGGLLFGRREAEGIRIQAFRTISCEHATGPSFTLSDRDLDELRKQIAASQTDGDLAGLEVLGWYVAHTRTPFQLTDRESAICDEFFPEPYQVTVLVKPERFQATKFGFLLRNHEGQMERDPVPNAIILPLPGRSSRSSDGPLASIPAPSDKPPTPASEGRKTSAVPAPSPSIPSTPLLAEESASFTNTASRHGVTRPRAAVRFEEVASDPTRAEPSDANPSELLTPVSPPSSDLPSIEEIKSRRFDRSMPKQNVRPVSDGRSYALRLALILIMAALLGSAAGYWAYSQLPSAVIPLEIRPQATGFVISWPTEQTRQAGYAGIRVNDGPQQLLTEDEKRAGVVRVPSSPASSLKVELIVQHRLRDSRGIVRYVATTAPSDLAPDGHVAH